MRCDENLDLVKTTALERSLDQKPETLQERAALLKKALADRYASVVVKAVRRLDEWEVEGLTEQLLSAYQRLTVDGAKRDPGCRAKTAILKALRTNDFSSYRFYLEALNYRQPEAVFGGSEDTAAELRGIAAMGLATSGWVDAPEHLLPLLVDGEPAARISGVRALAALGEPLVLRLKALQGDDEPLVTGECLESLLEMEGERVVGFVATFLNRREAELVEMAALALGASRLPSAYAPLRAAWDHQFRLRETLMVALATLRHPEADAFLKELVATGAPGIEALRPFGYLPDPDESSLD